MSSIKLKSILSPDVISVTPETPLSEALSILSEKKISCLLVEENNKPLGILTERDVVKIAAGSRNVAKMKLAEVMRSPVITLQSGIDILEGYAVMRKGKIRHLVVVDEQGAIEGVVTLTDIIKELGAKLTDNRSVFEIMTRKIVISKPDDTIHEISRKMTENSISCIIIEDDSKPVGIITERDIARFFLSGVDVSAESVSNWMSSPVYMINSNMPMPEAMHLMSQKKHRRLIVHNDNEKTVGLVTQSDIVRGMLEGNYIRGLRANLERKELALHESEKRYKQLFTNMLNGFALHEVVVNEDNKPIDYIFLEVNDTFETMTGLKCSEIIGKKVTEVLPGIENDPADWIGVYGKVALTGEGVRFEQYAAPLGKWYSVYAYRPRENQFAVILSDTTERKKAENIQKLQADQQTATSRLGLIALSGMGLDEVFQTAVVSISKTLDLEFTKILELLPDGKSLLLREGVGWKEGLVGHATVGTELDSQAGYTLKSNQPVITKDLRKESRFSGPSLLLDHGVISGMSLIIQGKDRPFGVLGAHTKRHKTFTKDDINFLQSISNVLAETIARKQAEEESKIMEEKLRHTQKLESLGVLAGGIAHDFNNILTSILGNTDLALDDLSPASLARDYIEEIQKGAKRAAELSHQMLAYSGKGKFVIENIDMNEIIKEMVHMLEVSISKKHSIKYDLAENLPSIEADINQIRQVIMNLILNASEAIGDNSGVISITTEAGECDKDCFKKMYLDDELPKGLYNFIQVADTGVGMDEETIKKIFDPFFTTKFTGRGLGMSAVLGIVRGHKGAINVESKPGKGTIFTVLLPPSGKESTTTKPDRQETAASWRGHGTILLVDDDKSVREVGKDMLEAIGFNVIMAVDGQEAVEIFRDSSNEIDCVLLDLTMPRMSGKECFLELRKIRKDVRIIIYSGYSKEETAKKFIDMGVNEFLQKPFQLITLKNKMRKVFEKDNI